MMGFVFLGAITAFLKLALGCGVAAAAVTIACDEDTHKFVKWLGGGKVKKVKEFDIGNEHTTTIGLTQYGKTYGTIVTMEKMKKPVLFFNTQHTPVFSKDWVEADGGNTIEQVIYALEKGHKVNFLPSEKGLDHMSRQLKGLTDKLYELGKLDFYFAVDEVHLFKLAKDKGGHNSLIRLATTGLGRGFKMIFISQRGASVDNTLYTQSTKHIMFALGKADYKYLDGLGFPTEEIENRVGGEKYKFIEFDQKSVSEVKMIE
jgi:hypothetical protein